MRIALVLVVAAGCDAVYDLRGRKPDAAVDAEVIIDAPIDAAEVTCAKDPLREDDEDDDDFPNSCDNCPHVSQMVLLDDDGDGVGDECDPRRGLPDAFDYFDGFDAQSLGLDFLPPTGTWRVEGGQLHADAVPVATDRLARLKHGVLNATVITAVHVVVSDDYLESAGVFAWIQQPHQSGSAVYPPGALLQIRRETTGGSCLILETSPYNPGQMCAASPEQFATGRVYRLTLDCRSTVSPKCTGTVHYADGTPAGVTIPVNLPTATVRTGPVGLRAYGVDVAFDYLVVIRHD